MTSIEMPGKEAYRVVVTPNSTAGGLPASGNFESSEAERGVRVLTRLISAELVMLLILSVLTLVWRDWSTLSALVVAVLLQIGPFWLVRRRHIQAGGVLFVVINIVITTAIAMVGQGIYDLAIIAFPIIFVFAGLGLSRKLFRLVVGIGVAAVCWLVVAENAGWLVPKPLPNDPTRLLYLTGVITMLLVAAFAVSLLVNNLHRSLDHANREIEERRKTEEALRESEDKYHQLFNNSEVAMYRTKADGSRFLEGNNKLLEIFGYTREELLGSPSVFHWADPLERTAVGKVLAAQGSVVDFECRLLTKRGDTRRCLVSARLNRQSAVWEGSILDVTERRKAELALLESEGRYRTLFEKTAEGILIADVDTKKIRHANPAVSRMLGYTQEELSGMSIFDIHPRDESASVSAEFMAVARGAKEMTTLPCLKKDGGMIYAEIHSANALIDGRESNVGFFTDITDQKESASRLENAAQEWRATFDSIGDFISIHDTDNRILRVNRAMAGMLNMQPQELIGRLCHEVMHGTAGPPAYCPNRLTLLTGKPEIKETFNARLGLHLQESTSPMFDERGAIRGSVNIIRDVTQRKRMEEQLLITDRLASIGELASGIAHELNNPLTSVIGFSQLLMEGDVPEDIREDLNTVHSEAQRAAVIVKNLLTFARKHAPVKQLSQVNTVIEDVLRLRAYEQKVNNIEIECRLDPGLPEIMIDHFQMQQVFLNVIVNAEFAMLEAHQRGKLVITTERSDGMVRAIFADDGPGIKPEDLKRVFDPFFTTKDVGKGTGLGLSICHGIVTEHGGQIYATSDAGKGAAFVVTLPVSGPSQ